MEQQNRYHVIVSERATQMLVAYCGIQRPILRSKTAAMRS